MSEPPEKARGKGSTVWRRTRFLLLGLCAYGALIVRATASNHLQSFSDAVVAVSTHYWWLLALLGLEVLHQVFSPAIRRSGAARRFVQARQAGLHAHVMRINPWTRFRVARFTKVVVVVVLASALASWHYHCVLYLGLPKFVVAIFASLPTYLQYSFIILIGVAQFAMIFWFMSRGGMDTYFPGDVKTRFDDVWGQDSVVDRVRENIIYLKDPDLIEERGGYVPGGILLWGPPGTGKTLLAEAVAGETHNPFVFVTPGAFSNMFMGVGILKVRALFKKLRKLSLRYGGVIVFFDEADALGSRGGSVSEHQVRVAECRVGAYISGASAAELERGAGHPSAERMVGPGGMGGGDGGTLQALLAELSGLKKPRGFLNRVGRRWVGLTPKPPPKYRILVMMASNLPGALDPALLRPGRIDRIYKVGYPAKEGRIRTYRGYLARVEHSLSDEEIDRLATITPYATGATIKDLVNEALINSIRDGRSCVTWRDIVRAKQLKDLGPPEDVTYIERERHAVAIHEACHAVVAVLTRRHMTIDLATIEKGGTYLGMVASIPPDDQFTSWRSEFEADIKVSLASLAGERLFFGGDNSSGVSGDLEGATKIAALMEAHWGMGTTISSERAVASLGFGGVPRGPRVPGTSKTPDLSERVETRLAELYRETMTLLEESRALVLRVTHALETYKTLTGEDVEAIIAGKQGPLIDGRPYEDPAFAGALERYHVAAAEAHRTRGSVEMGLPIA